MDTLDLLGAPYIARISDAQIRRLLGISGGVVLEGPRGCGKSMSGAWHAQSAILMDSNYADLMMETTPASVLAGAQPRLIDEWQLYPQLWNIARRQIDSTPGSGQFIFAGSSVPADDATRHTGAARFVRMRMRTLAWSEKRAMNPNLPDLPEGLLPVSLGSLFAGEKIENAVSYASIDDSIEYLLTSGFPAQVRESTEDAAVLLEAYAREVAHTDIKGIAQIRHDPIVIEQLIKAMARAVASETTFETLRKDIRAVAPSITVETVTRLVHNLMRLFVVDSVAAWAPRLRSRAVLRTSPKYHLADPALAAAVLKMNSQRLKEDLASFGLLFESAVVHDFTVMVEAMGGEVRHFRDSNGYELDAVALLPDGRWGAIEVKLGSGKIAEAEKRMNQVLSQIDSDRPASFAVVVTAAGNQMTLPSGVQTFPLLSLTV